MATMTIDDVVIGMLSRHPKEQTLGHAMYETAMLYQNTICDEYEKSNPKWTRREGHLTFGDVVNTSKRLAFDLDVEDSFESYLHRNAISDRSIPVNQSQLYDHFKTVLESYSRILRKLNKDGAKEGVQVFIQKVVAKFIKRAGDFKGTYGDLPMFTKEDELKAHGTPFTMESEDLL